MQLVELITSLWGIYALIFFLLSARNTELFLSEGSIQKYCCHFIWEQTYTPVAYSKVRMRMDPSKAVRTWQAQPEKHYLWLALCGPQHTLHFQLAINCICVSPACQPQHTGSCSCIWCGRLRCRELFQFVNDLLSWVIYLCLSRSPAWVKWTTDLSFPQLGVAGESGLLSVTQPGRNSRSWQTVSVT